MNLSAGILNSQRNFYSPIEKTKDFDRLVFESFQEKNKMMKTLTIDPSRKIVKFNKKELNLSKQKKLFSIFSIFFQQNFEGVKRKDLIEKIYPSTILKEPSSRQLNCYNHNIIKLLSRARKLASQDFKTNILELEWFPYNMHSKKWDFYRLNLTNISKLLNQRKTEDFQKTFIEKEAKIFS